MAATAVTAAATAAAFAAGAPPASDDRVLRPHVPLRPLRSHLHVTALAAPATRRPAHRGCSPLQGQASSRRSRGPGPPSRSSSSSSSIWSSSRKTSGSRGFTSGHTGLYLLSSRGVQCRASANPQEEDSVPAPASTAIALGRSSSSNSGNSSSSTSPDPASAAQPTPYKPTILDDFFLMLFRRKMFLQTQYKSDKPGYEGMIEEARVLLNMFPKREDTERAAVRILYTMFPEGLLPLFKRFIAPLADGRAAAILTAQVTQLTCQWLMGPSRITTVELEDGTKLDSGVKIEKCRFLEETQCVGSCIHTCKIPTQSFMQEHMGVPLWMEPNYEDLSCEFKYGVRAPQRDADPALKTPCLALCPVAGGRPQATSTSQCPTVVA